MAAVTRVAPDGWLIENSSSISRSIQSTWIQETTGSAGVIKTINGLVIASVKTRNGLAAASIKAINGLAYQ